CLRVSRLYPNYKPCEYPSQPWADPVSPVLKLPAGHFHACRASEKPQEPLTAAPRSSPKAPKSAEKPQDEHPLVMSNKLCQAYSVPLDLVCRRGSHHSRPLTTRP